MLKTPPLCLLLLLNVLVASAQLHIGKSEEAVIASLGTDYNKLYDPEGNEVLSYISEVKSHPLHGDFTLYSFYLFEHGSCVMQQTIVPSSQKQALVKGFDTIYSRVEENVWVSREDFYYVVSEYGDNMKVQIVRGDCYKAGPRLVLNASNQPR